MDILTKKNIHRKSSGGLEHIRSDLHPSTDNCELKDANNGRSLSVLDLRINHVKHMRFGF